MIEASAPRAGRVGFEPGARTAWRTHPLGQNPHVLSGTGGGQAWGGPVDETRAGDTVWIPPGEKRRHGAGPDNGMTHLALQASLDGSHVTRLEHVNDGEHARAPRERSQVARAKDSRNMAGAVRRTGATVPVLAHSAAPADCASPATAPPRGRGDLAPAKSRMTT